MLGASQVRPSRRQVDDPLLSYYAPFATRRSSAVLPLAPSGPGAPAERAHRRFAPRPRPSGAALRRAPLVAWGHALLL
jgi:hypothetical protein